MVYRLSTTQAKSKRSVYRLKGQSSHALNGSRFFRVHKDWYDLPNAFPAKGPISSLTENREDFCQFFFPSARLNY